MAKDRFVFIGDDTPRSIDRFSLVPDSALGALSLSADDLLDLLEAGDVKAFLVAALSALRRERGRCQREDGMDCILRFSSPLPVENDAEGSWFLAAGFRDAELFRPSGVLLQWSDSHGAVRWDTVDVMRTERLLPLAREVSASLGLIHSKPLTKK